MPDDQVEVVDAVDRRRFEAVVEGDVAGFTAYRLDGDLVVFTHTEVDDRFQGQGVGSKLVRGALDEVRRRGARIVPRCPFVRAYVERHAEYADLVASRPADPAP